MLARYVREAEVYVVDLPGAELVVDGVDPRALLVLDTPLVEDGAPPRVRVFVYQRNVERAAGSLEVMETELQAALEREVTAVFLEGQKPEQESAQLRLDGRTRASAALVPQCQLPKPKP